MPNLLGLVGWGEREADALPRSFTDGGLNTRSRMNELALQIIEGLRGSSVCILFPLYFLLFFLSPSPFGGLCSRLLDSFVVRVMTALIP